MSFRFSVISFQSCFCLINVSSMNLSFENHCVSNSPSKLDQWSKPRPAAKLVLLLARRFDSYHTPQSLRDSSSILEEQPDIQLFIFVELTLVNISVNSCKLVVSYKCFFSANLCD